MTDCSNRQDCYCIAKKSSCEVTTFGSGKATNKQKSLSRKEKKHEKTEKFSAFVMNANYYSFWD